MKKDSSLAKIQLFLPIVLSTILAVGFFVDFRELGLQIRLPSFIIVAALILMIGWVIANIYSLKTSYKNIILFSFITIVPFLIVDIATSAGWLSLLGGALFITIPLTSFAIMSFLVSLILKKKN